MFVYGAYDFSHVEALLGWAKLPKNPVSPPKLWRIRPRSMTTTPSPRSLGDEQARREVVNALQAELKRLNDSIQNPFSLPGQWFSFELCSVDIDGQLTVLACEGYGKDFIPRKMPSHVGINFQVINNSRRVYIPSDLQNNDHFQNALSTLNPLWKDLEGGEKEQFRKFMTSLDACLKLPIFLRIPRGMIAERPIGILAIVSNRPFHFDEHFIQDLERFCQTQLSPHVAELRKQAIAAQRVEYVRKALLERVPERAAYDVQPILDKFYQRFREQFGAARTLVRVHYPGERLFAVPHQYLASSGYSKDSYRAEYQVDNDQWKGTTFWEAFQTRTSLFIPNVKNTSQPHSSTQNNPPAKGHAAVVLVADSRAIGVWSTSWERVTPFSVELRRQLEILGAALADVVSEHLKTRALMDIEDTLTWATRNTHADSGLFPVALMSDIEANLKQVLEESCRMIQAESAVIYQLDRGTGLYQLVAEHNNPVDLAARLRETRFSRNDECGLVSWVARHKKPINIFNHKDLEELDRRNEDPPRWKLLDEFDVYFQEPTSFLLHPICHEDEIIGVIRFAKPTRYHGFGRMDEWLVRYVANRVSRWIYLSYTRPKRLNAYHDFQVAARRFLCRQEMMAETERIIHSILGPCSIALRVPDYLPGDSPSARPRQTLHRLFALGDQDWVELPRRHMGKDEDIPGYVRKTGLPLVFSGRESRDAFFARHPVALSDSSRRLMETHPSWAIYPLFAAPERRFVGIFGIARTKEHTLSLPDRIVLRQIAEDLTAYLDELERKWHQDFLNTLRCRGPVILAQNPYSQPHALTDALRESLEYVLQSHVNIEDIGFTKAASGLDRATILNWSYEDGVTNALLTFHAGPWQFEFRAVARPGHALEWRRLRNLMVFYHRDIRPWLDLILR